MNILPVFWNTQGQAPAHLLAIHGHGCLRGGDQRVQGDSHWQEDHRQDILPPRHRPTWLIHNRVIPAAAGGEWLRWANRKSRKAAFLCPSIFSAYLPLRHLSAAFLQCYNSQRTSDMHKLDTAIIVHFVGCSQRIPERIIEKAVKGMLPKGSLGRDIRLHLKVRTTDGRTTCTNALQLARARSCQEVTASLSTFAVLQLHAAIYDAGCLAVAGVPRCRAPP